MIVPVVWEVALSEVDTKTGESVLGNVNTGDGLISVDDVVGSVVFVKRTEGNVGSNVGVMMSVGLNILTVVVA